MSQLRELAEEECELEMTPMIDVTFLLLIFFMCTLKFKTLEGKLAAYLPKDVGVNTTQAEPIEKIEILIRPIKEGTKYFPLGSAGNARGELYTDETGKKRFVYGPDRVMEYKIGPTRTNDVNELRRRLAEVFDQRVRANPDDKVPATIDARPGTVYGDIVPVLDAAIEGGFKDITFVGAYDENIK